jgi:uncharacterized protein (TIGR04551 family)
LELSMISVFARLLPSRPTAALAASALALALTGGSALAQTGPAPFPSGGPGGGAQEEPKKEGVAEAAPKTPGLLPTTPALPAPKSRRKKFEIFELNGYFRLRTEWFKNFHQNFRDDLPGGAPFPRSRGCIQTPESCDDTLSSANMRLRLEPTINVDENASVHMQIDVLDNLLLGSTAEGENLPNFDTPLGAFADSQQPQQAGVNETRDAVRVKRAWAEVATPLGVLKFGRQPDHWAMGMVHNSGSEDPISGGYDLDSDYGDSVDRVIFSTLIPSTRLRAAVGIDWPMSGLSASQVGLDYQGAGQPYDLDNADDVNQWVFILSRMDAPTDFRDNIDRGELALNYGAYVGYRTQGWDRVADTSNDTEEMDPNSAAATDTILARVNYKSYVPDAWIKLGWRGFLFEAEAAAVLGSLQRPLSTDDVDLRQFGGIGRLSYRAVDDKLNVALEVGFASGDQWDNDDPGRINIRNASGLPGPNDDDLTTFLFDRDYKVDLILFRELIGAVTNAIYVKPSVSFAVTKSLVLRGAAITSFAHRKIATPGNASGLGVELNGDVGYEGQSFFAGLSYGLLFPLAGLDHPAGPEGVNPSPFVFAGDNIGQAGNAHAIQARFVLRF